MKHHSVLFSLVFILVTVTTDQGIKFWVIRNMALGEHIDLLPFLALYHTRNSGIAFSMLSSFSAVGIIILTTALIMFFFWLLWSTEPQRKLARSGYLLVIGGAIGNLADRLRLHYVTDYILFYTGNWSFAIFNLADAFITTGAFFLVFRELWSWWQKKHSEKNDISSII